MAGARKLALRSAGVDAKQSADFFVRISFDVVQHENFTIAVGQMQNRAIEVQALRSRCADDGRFGRLAGVNARASATAEFFPAAIDDDADEPGGQARLPAKRRQIAAGANPGVLDHICGGVIHSAEEAERNAIEQRSVKAVESAKSGFIPVTAVGIHQFALACFVLAHRLGSPSLTRLLSIRSIHCSEPF